MENISFPDFKEYLKERFTPSVRHSTFAEARTGTRVCCLYRVSTEKQVDHDNNDEPDIPMQRKACHKFCEEKDSVSKRGGPSSLKNRRTVFLDIKSELPSGMLFRSSKREH